MNKSLFSFKTTMKLLTSMTLLIMLSIIVINSFKISQSNERIQTQQLKALTDTLISQAAASAGYLLVSNDQVTLKMLANQLAHDPLVIDVNIYNALGVPVATSDNALSARVQIGLDTPLATKRIGKQQLVEPIFNPFNSNPESSAHAIGFIRVTFETGKVTASSNHYYRKTDRYMYTMILMSFIIGLLLPKVLPKRAGNKKASRVLKDWLKQT
ncbi:AhpA/YtjB family protein [Vibrio sp.]|nr:AhpA/YtjB family protein [Vibrio sp.]